MAPTPIATTATTKDSQCDQELCSIFGEPEPAFAEGYTLARPTRRPRLRLDFAAGCTSSAPPSPPRSPLYSCPSDTAFAFGAPYQPLHPIAGALGEAASPCTSLCSLSGISECETPLASRSPLTPFSDRSGSFCSSAVSEVDVPDEIDPSSQFYEPVLPTRTPPAMFQPINCETMTQLVRGELDLDGHELLILDCRYPYEFAGGHIVGARNMYQPEDMDALLFAPDETAKRYIIVLHCEFSQQRAPAMFQYIRSKDRSLSEYPKLRYPQMYTLECGYSAFHEFCTASPAGLVEPHGYVKMKDIRFRAEEKQHRRIVDHQWKRLKAARRTSMPRSRSFCFGPPSPCTPDSFCAVNQQ